MEKQQWGWREALGGAGWVQGQANHEVPREGEKLHARPASRDGGERDRVVPSGLSGDTGHGTDLSLAGFLGSPGHWGAQSAPCQGQNAMLSPRCPSACGSPSPARGYEPPENVFHSTLLPIPGALRHTYCDPSWPPSGDPGTFPACPLPLLPRAVWAPFSKCLRPSVLRGRGQQRGGGGPQGRGTPGERDPRGEYRPAAFLQVSPHPSCPGCHRGAVQAMPLSPAPGSRVWFQRVNWARLGLLGSSLPCTQGTGRAVRPEVDRATEGRGGDSLPPLCSTLHPLP